MATHQETITFEGIQAEQEGGRSPASAGHRASRLEERPPRVSGSGGAPSPQAKISDQPTLVDEAGPEQQSQAVGVRLLAQKARSECCVEDSDEALTGPTNCGHSPSIPRLWGRRKSGRVERESWTR
jgi:hypothetical protein